MAAYGNKTYKYSAMLTSHSREASRIKKIRFYGNNFNAKIFSELDYSIIGNHSKLN